MKQKTQSEVNKHLKTKPASKPSKGDVYAEFDAEIYTLMKNPNSILATFTDYGELEEYCRKHKLNLTKTTGLDNDDEEQNEVTVNESKHTPGPWNYGYVRNDNNVCPVPYYEIGAGHSMFWTALVNASERVTEPKEAEANARLIAAAPDLLICLSELLSIHQEPTRGDLVWRLAVVEQCEKAIKKATK